MNARTIGRIERGVERIASVIFAGAVGFAAYVFLKPICGEPQVLLFAVAAGAAGLVLCGIAMRSGSSRATLIRPPVFDVREFELFEPEELVLTAEDQVRPAELLLTDEERIKREPSSDAGEPLVLDDVLAQLGPDSRVVRLFDRHSMPTPGQLQSRIDNHLGHGPSGSAHDASQALSDALAELRRSLR